jgi:hypothetical protein
LADVVSGFSRTILADVVSRFSRTIHAQETAPAATPAPNNYASEASWLCLPGRTDACRTDLMTSVVRADGGVTRETWTADPNAPIDCFYVYPTVSTDATPNSDMVADPAEVNVVHQQFARFASKCRPYAPLYRQVTLAGLRRMIAGGGGGSALAGGLQYADVRDAWHYYLEHHNRGRGVVLVGHSQGSFILAELMRQEIDGKPVQSRLVSAILLGATMAVPRGKDVGGTFQQIPLCRKPDQVGCLITYVSFRSTSPPPANSRFGRVSSPDQVAACTNPAALGGGRADLHAYLATTSRTITGTANAIPWTGSAQQLDTPWVSVPGLLSAQCTSNEYATFLEITVNGNPSDPRTDDIYGDLGAGAQILKDWGLHLIDANLGIGNLLDIVGQQAKAWVKR